MDIPNVSDQKRDHTFLMDFGNGSSSDTTSGSDLAASSSTGSGDGTLSGGISKSITTKNKLEIQFTIENGERIFHELFYWA